MSRLKSSRVTSEKQFVSGRFAGSIALEKRRHTTDANGDLAMDNCTKAFPPVLKTSPDRAKVWSRIRRLSVLKISVWPDSIATFGR
jgi:hypothetical protein